MTDLENNETDKNPLVALLSDAQRKQLFANGRATLRNGWFGQPEVDRMPVAMLRCSCGSVYLLSELDPSEPSIMYGLYDDSEGTPTLDTVDLDALFDSSDMPDWAVPSESSDAPRHTYENVLLFNPTMDIRAYWRAARKLGSVSALFDQPT
jgi:hypothetical protein